MCAPSTRRAAPPVPPPLTPRDVHNGAAYTAPRHMAPVPLQQRVPETPKLREKPVPKRDSKTRRAGGGNHICLSELKSSSTILRFSSAHDRRAVITASFSEATLCPRVSCAQPRRSSPPVRALIQSASVGQELRQFRLPPLPSLSRRTGDSRAASAEVGGPRC